MRERLTKLVKLVYVRARDSPTTFCVSVLCLMCFLVNLQWVSHQTHSCPMQNQKMNTGLLI